MVQLQRTMVGRDPDEDHRTSTPLELFYDLAFVVAVALASSELHHGLAEGHVAEAVAHFPLMFFGIWWAWMNFTWFASAYDTDDVFYRLAVFVQMTGVLIVAAGMPRVMATDEWGVVVLGYVVMRLALVALWLRAARQHPARRTTALRYAGGIVVLQALWVARLLLPDSIGTASFLVLVVLELAVPAWAESAGRTSWHPTHIAERYGLFTIIVLGESILAATVGVQTALDGHVPLGDLMPVIVGGLLLVFSLWWMYFDLPEEEMVSRARAAFEDRLRGPFLWGYGHYFVFGAAAAVGAGIAVQVDVVAGHAHLSDGAAGLAVTVPVMVFVGTLWALHWSAKDPGPMRDLAVPVGLLLLLLASWSPAPVLFAGVVVAALVALHLLFGSGFAAAATDDVTA